MSFKIVSASIDIPSNVPLGQAPRKPVLLACFQLVWVIPVPGIPLLRWRTRYLSNVTLFILLIWSMPFREFALLSVAALLLHQTSLGLLPRALDYVLAFLAFVFARGLLPRALDCRLAVLAILFSSSSSLSAFDKCDITVGLFCHSGMRT